MSTTLVDKTIKNMSLEISRYCGEVLPDNKCRLKMQIIIGDGRGTWFGLEFSKKEAIDIAIAILQGMTEYD